MAGGYNWGVTPSAYLKTGLAGYKNNCVDFAGFLSDLSIGSSQM
jgi:hypothetical protein